jgi:hypothetical protein
MFEISGVKINGSVDLQECNFCRTCITMCIKYIHIQEYPLFIVVDMSHRKIVSNFHVGINIYMFILYVCSFLKMTYDAKVEFIKSTERVLNSPDLNLFGTQH